MGESIFWLLNGIHNLFIAVLHLRHKLEYFRMAVWEDQWINTARELVWTQFEETYAGCEVKEAVVVLPSDEVSYQADFFCNVADAMVGTKNVQKHIWQSPCPGCTQALSCPWCITALPCWCCWECGWSTLLVVKETDDIPLTVSYGPWLFVYSWSITITSQDNLGSS